MAVTSFRARQERVWEAEDAILSERFDHPMSTDSLISKLKYAEFDDYSIRAAIWALIERGKLKLLSEQDNVYVSRRS